MCGISGVLHPQGDLTDALSAMQRALHHRGPDGSGQKRFPDAHLGHTRLSIVDLSEAGAQPMTDATGQAAITFNGEIYDHASLRRECEAAGLRFQSSSDTEIILNLYLLHGPASFARLNGMFAF